MNHFDMLFKIQSFIEYLSFHISIPLLSIHTSLTKILFQDGFWSEAGNRHGTKLKVFHSMNSTICRNIIKTLTGSRLSIGDIDDLHFKILNESIRAPRAPAGAKAIGKGAGRPKVASTRRR
jgi:hypothetical protein